MNSFSLKKLIICLVMVVFMPSLNANTLTANSNADSVPQISSSKTKKEARLEKFLHSKFGQWHIKKLEKKVDKKQKRLEKRKQHWTAKGNTTKVDKIQKTKDDLATYGIILMIGGAFCLVIGLLLLVLSLNSGVYAVFLTLGGLGLVAGFVLLLIDILA